MGTAKPRKGKSEEDGIERMNKALKAALETPPRKHADEPKRRKTATKKPAK